jgi:hypothetical protein
VAAVGGLVEYRAVSAFRTRRSPSLLLLAVGLALLTIGMPVAWTSMYVLSENMLLCTSSSFGAALAGTIALVASIQLKMG